MSSGQRHIAPSVAINGALATRLVSTNQPEPLKNPPVTKPRARRMVPTDTDTLAHCQPPAGSAGRPVMRVPAPRLSQSVPLAETSRVARQASGLVPARCQVSVGPGLPDTPVGDGRGTSKISDKEQQP